MIELHLISFIKTSSTVCKDKKQVLCIYSGSLGSPKKNCIKKLSKEIIPHLLTVDFACGLFMIYICLNAESYQLSNAIIRNFISRTVFQESGKTCNTTVEAHRSGC